MFKTFNVLPLNKRILLAGCGGGYDCFVSLPLYFSLRQQLQTQNVFIANLSFTDIKYLELFPKITDSCYDIEYDPEILKLESNIKYFPEYELARELSEHVYTFVDNGMKSYELAYIELIKKLNIDIIILCDGGCDSIMTGNEENLGTIVEDAMSMLVVNKLLNYKLISSAYLLILGATVDTFGEINREDFISNINALEKTNVLIEKIIIT
jgi:hypothetical protein